MSPNERYSKIIDQISFGKRLASDEITTTSKVNT